MGLSQLQTDLLQAITELTETRGFAPSVRELMAAARVASMSSVHRALVALRDEGFIEWDQGRCRTIRVVDR